MKHSVSTGWRENPSVEQAIRVRAFAKLNLSLVVLGRRPDGYHELRTIFQTISLSDEISIRYRPGGKFQLRVSSQPPIENNLVERACRLLQSTMGFEGSLEIHLDKRIPIGAGLGGGSSDAAAILLAVPAIVKMRLDWKLLYELACQLGSDVPFFLHGGTALALGRGEEVYPLPSLPARTGIVLVAGTRISTGEAYQWLSPLVATSTKQEALARFQRLIERYTENSSLVGLAELVENDFEKAVLPRFPELQHLKERLLEAGALWSLMTGSGSTVYGIFENVRQANRARELVARAAGQQPLLARPITGRQYRRLWWQWLQGYCQQGLWPPEPLVTRKGSDDCLA